MPRTLTAPFLAASQASLLRPALFIEAHFTSGPLYGKRTAKYRVAGSAEM